MIKYDNMSNYTLAKNPHLITYTCYKLSYFEAIKLRNGLLNKKHMTLLCLHMLTQSNVKNIYFLHKFTKWQISNVIH